MIEKYENIDRFFKNKLEYFEDNPEPVVWENISEKLGHNRKRKLILFVSRIAAGITLVASLSVGYYFLNKDTSKILTEAIEQTNTPIKEKAAITTGKSARLKTDRVSDNKYSEEDGISKSINFEESEKSLAAKQDERVIDSELTPLRLKSIFVNKIENTYSEDVLIAERIKKQQAEENQKNAVYSIEEDLGYKDKSGESKWSIGGQLAPLYSYRNVSSDYLESYVKDQINSEESGIISYAMGLNVAMAPGKRLSIQSGIYYSKYGQQTGNVFTNNVSASAWDAPGSGDGTGSGENFTVITQSIGTVSNNDDLLKFNQSLNEELNNRDYYNISNTANLNPDATATQYFEYLEIPLVIKYKVIDRKIDLNVSSGISTHFLIGNDIYLDYDNSEFPENVNVNTINYSSSVGLGIEYPILSRLLFNVEPKFKYYINPIVKRPSYTIHPYSFGIFTGISYMF